MSDDGRRLCHDHNPFSTSAVKPGAIAFQFHGGTSAATLVAQLRRNRWRGEIVGPHGSGKSTLLQSLFPVIKATGREVCYYVAKANDSGLPMSTSDQTAWTDSTLVVVEGYELLSRRDQNKLARACREKRAGLLITCHASQGLPVLLHTVITVELAISLVEQLVPDGCEFVGPVDVRDSFARHGQNVRELLFEMYDLYEQRRPR